MKTKDLTLTSMLVAIILLLALTPNLGFISFFGVVSITILHIPVLIGGTINKKISFILGTVFGLVSLLMAITKPAGLFDPVFINPLVSVLPRVLLGFILVDIYKMVEKLGFKNRQITLLTYYILGSIIHSLLVIIPMYFVAKLGFYPDVLGYKENVSTFLNQQQNIINFLFVGLGVQILAEAVFSGLVGTPISMVIEKIRGE